MSTQKHLTESELQDIQNTLDSINERQQQGLIDAEEALKEFYAVKKIMTDTFDRSVNYEEEQPERLVTWRNVLAFEKVLEDEKFSENLNRETKFPAGSVLDIEASSRCMKARSKLLLPSKH